MIGVCGHSIRYLPRHHNANRPLSLSFYFKIDLLLQPVNSRLCEAEETGVVETVVDGRVELQVLVKTGDFLNLGLLQVPASDLEILLQTTLVVGLGDDSTLR